MRTTVLSGTGLEVSTVCLGTMTFGSQVSEPEAARMVDYSLDQGVNFLDTANVYNNGVSEEITGRILGPRRSEVVLATKVRGKMTAGDESYVGLSASAVRRAAEDSLRRLGTDYIDVYYLHMPDREAEIAETLEEVDRLRREGKVRWIGTSNYAAWQMAEMATICRDRGFQEPMVAQPMYNLLARGIEQEYLEFTSRYRVANVCYNPLAGGLLSGKQSFDRGPIPGTRFDGNKMYLNRYWHGEYFRAVEALKAVAADLGVTLAELALRWVFHQAGADCVILGASRFAHVEANINASCGDALPAEALETCDAVWQELRGPTPQYNR